LGCRRKIKMKNKLARLIDVKSIVTILLAMVFCYLAIVKVITGSEFLTVFIMIIGFYFGTQATKGTPLKEE